MPQGNAPPRLRLTSPAGLAHIPARTALQKAPLLSYIPFPDISPVLYQIEVFGYTLALRWYALAYIAGIMIAFGIVKSALNTARLWQTGNAPMTFDQAERLLTWIIFGIILGGRLGFVLFYEPEVYLAEPWKVLQVWKGGMSFHGGFLGVVIATMWFCKREAIAMLRAGDLLAVAVAPGLFLGRIANFINAELWGRPTSLPWGVAFPGEAAQTCAGVTGICARHPSQIYEAVLEGVILGGLLAWLAWRRGWFARPGALMGLFIAGYGVARFVVEFVRQPDANFVAPGNPLGLALQFGEFGLTKGQELSLPMIAIGLYFIWRARRA
jgi:phosphatidylglycerol---prolipoprotein diacylglyceryl transferase